MLCYNLRSFPLLLSQLAPDNFVIQAPLEYFSLLKTVVVFAALGDGTGDWQRSNSLFIDVSTSFVFLSKVGEIIQ